MLYPFITYNNLVLAYVIWHNIQMLVLQLGFSNLNRQWIITLGIRLHTMIYLFIIICIADYNPAIV